MAAIRQELERQTRNGPPPRLPVVLVDDDALTRDGMKALLTAWGYEVTAVAGFDDASALAAHGGTTGQPLIVIADLVLGGHSGIDVLDAFQARHRGGVAGIIVTGATDAAALKHVSASAWPVLHKPVRPHQLRALMRRLAPVV